MLVQTLHEHKCINCQEDTYLLDTNTNTPICSDDCQRDLWLENIYIKQKTGEHFGLFG